MSKIIQFRLSDKLAKKLEEVINESEIYTNRSELIRKLIVDYFNELNK